MALNPEVYHYFDNAILIGLLSFLPLNISMEEGKNHWGAALFVGRNVMKKLMWLH